MKTNAESTRPPASKRGLWAKILAGKFLVVSIAVHLLFGVGATLCAVLRYQAMAMPCGASARLKGDAGTGAFA